MKEHFDPVVILPKEIFHPKFGYLYWIVPDFFDKKHLHYFKSLKDAEYFITFSGYPYTPITPMAFFG